MACQTAEMVEVASPPVHRRTSWVGFHAVFAAVAVAVLLIPVPALGLRVLALVVIYNVALPVFARRTDDDVLWVTWVVLAPMSVLMVLPDWFLSAVLGTLRFPDTGAPYIGTMPLFMAGMWAIALIPVMLLAPGWSRFAVRLQASQRPPGRGFCCSWPRKGWRLCFRCGSRWESPRSQGWRSTSCCRSSPCAWPVSSWCAGPERVRWR